MKLCSHEVDEKKAKMTPSSDVLSWSSRQNIATLVGFSVVCAWLLSPVIAAPAYYFLTDSMQVTALPAWGAVIFGHNLVILVGIPMLVHFWEAKPLSSIGFGKPSELDFPSAFIVGVLFIWITEVTDSLLARLAFPSTPDNPAPLLATLTSIPVWFSFIRALTNGGAEEMGCRGFAIERLEEFTGSTWIAASVPCTADILSHYPVWGLRGMLAMAPGQILFTCFYIKQRSLVASMTAHILVNLFVTVIWPQLLVHS